MGLAFFIVVAFIATFIPVYLFMRFSCFIKAKYAKTENKADLNLFENFLFRVLTMLMCESCKESCKNHHKLFARAIFFSLIVAVIATFIAYLMR